MEAWWDLLIPYFWLGLYLAVGSWLASLPGLVPAKFEFPFQNDLCHISQYLWSWCIVSLSAPWRWLDVLMLPLKSCDSSFDLKWPWEFEPHLLRMLPVYLLQRCCSLRLLPACWLDLISYQVFSLSWWVIGSYLGFCSEIKWMNTHAFLGCSPYNIDDVPILLWRFNIATLRWSTSSPIRSDQEV